MENELVKNKMNKGKKVILIILSVFIFIAISFFVVTGAMYLSGGNSSPTPSGAPTYFQNPINQNNNSVGFTNGSNDETANIDKDTGTITTRGNIIANYSTGGNGYFRYLGSLTSKILKGFFTDLQVDNAINSSTANATAFYENGNRLALNTTASIQSLVNNSINYSYYTNFAYNVNSSWNESLANNLYAKYNFTDNNFNGSGNFTTIGIIKIDGSDDYVILKQWNINISGNLSLKGQICNTTNCYNLAQFLNDTNTGNSSWNESYANTKYGNISGAGANNQVCYFNGSNIIKSSSNLFFDGTKLGVGTSSVSSASALTVNGGNLDVINNGKTTYFEPDFVGSGEAPAGSSIRASDDLTFLLTLGTPGLKIATTYWDGSQERSAWEIANAAGFGNLLLMKSGGNVGIGTSGPDRKLDILDASNPQIRLTQADGSVYADFQVASNGYLYIIPSGGRVGIGTTTPSYNFHIQDATNPAMVVQDTTNNVITMIQALDTEGLFGTSSNHALGLYTNGTRKVAIDTSGNVGIGTSNPTQVLDVRGNINYSGNTTGYNSRLITFQSIIEEGASKSRLFGYQTTSSIPVGSFEIYNNNYSTTLPIAVISANLEGNSSKGKLRFSVRGDSGLLEGMSINGSIISISNILQLSAIILPACSSAINGGLARNNTGLYYCNSTHWKNIA